MLNNPFLAVKNLHIEIKSQSKVIHPVNRVSFDIKHGETFAIVGESGCGKTTIAMAMLRLLPDNAQIVAGSEVWINNQDICQLSEYAMRSVRGLTAGIIFQDPMAALNPVLTIGEQIKEAINLNQYKTKTAIRSRITQLLQDVHLPDPESQLSRYPHQLSGGMKQRVMIAMALAKEPDLLIADEPTTALDVTTQAQVLSLIKELQAKNNMAVMLITHDLGVVAQMADKVAVMYAGHIVEEAASKDFFQGPKHPYSIKLLAALPEKNERDKPLAMIPGRVPLMSQPFTLCRFKERCFAAFDKCEKIKPENTFRENYGYIRCHLALEDKILQGESSMEDINNQNNQLGITAKKQNPNDVIRVQQLKVHYPIKKGLFKRTVGYVKAVDGVSLALEEGKTLALVGESGSGKTTVGRAILKLVPATEGNVLYLGKDLNHLSRRHLREVRADLQMIFQDPFSSMNPRMRIGQIIEEGMIALKVGTDAKERQDRIDVLLAQVGLNPEHKLRYPHEFSGGQRQRVAIARALAVGPRVIICDEPTSALDVSVQAQILNLLKSLQNEFDISYLFITHDIGVVKYIADTVAVMHHGQIVETGLCETVLNAPQHPYTQALLKAVPKVDKSEDAKSIRSQDVSF